MHMQLALDHVYVCMWPTAAGQDVRHEQTTVCVCLVTLMYVSVPSIGSYYCNMVCIYGVYTEV